MSSGHFGPHHYGAIREARSVGHEQDSVSWLTRALDRAASLMAYGAPTLAVLTFWTVDFLQDRARLGPEPAPTEWVTAATQDDRLAVDGMEIAYWGKPDARYSRYATKGKKKPKGIIVHFTRVKPVLWMVKYGHVRDASRGGASFGYHFYVGRDGKVVQGAPLSKRTNHIKSIRRKERTQTARHLWSGNTIGISMVGGCDKLLRPTVWWRMKRCGDEFLTPEQIKAGLAVIKALQQRFDMACRDVYGHGEVQTDRDDFEGATLARLVREGCVSPTAPDAPAEVQSKPENTVKKT